MAHPIRPDTSAQLFNDDKDRYIVICKDDSGAYRLVTRRTFDSKGEAEFYSTAIAHSRDALVVACDNRTVILRKEEL
jgi:hypothetical protein